jgi:hypothetical protein
MPVLSKYYDKLNIMTETLILSYRNDRLSIALHKQLQSLAIDSKLVMAHDLALASSWLQTITPNGQCFTEIILRNGLVINSNNLKSVYNRIKHIEMAHFSNPTDQVYANMEMFALYISFLKNIENAMIEPLQASQLILEEPNMLYYFKTAAAAGLNVLDYLFTTSPKWQRATGLTVFNPIKTHKQPFYRKSAHLVWQNEPIISFQPYKKIYKVIVVAGTALSLKLEHIEPAINQFAKQTGKVLLELQIAVTENGCKLYSVNDFPITATPETIAALATCMIKKRDQYDTIHGNTI